MELSEIDLPNHGTYDFGVGIERLTGTAKNLAVKPTPSSPSFALGPIQSFDVSRITSTHDLQRLLGIDASASYGCASFGAGASARFAFASDAQVHSSSLFVAITCTIRCPDLSIIEAVLSDAASGVANDPELFEQRYGNMFARSCRRGGIFVAMMRVETFDDAESNRIEAELHGTYGLFSADAKTKFSKVTTDHAANTYCTIYAEGGPKLQIHDPTSPVEMLDQANAWLKAMYDDPATYAVAYEWTFSPMSIVEGPRPANAADIQHSEDVLTYCGTERATLLDQLNRLNWWVRHQDKYDWSGADTPATMADAAARSQQDLDLVAACAVGAMNDPTSARMPADFAVAKGLRYPLSLPLPKEPRPLPSAMPRPAAAGWTRRSPMLGLSGAVYLLAAGDGTFHAVGSRVESYDPGTDTWSVSAMMPDAFKGGPVVLTSTGAIAFVVAVQAIGHTPNSACLGIFDPKANSVRMSAPMPQPRSGGGLTLGANGNVYMVGGWTVSAAGGPSAIAQEVQEYDPAGDSWQARAPLPTVRAGFCVATGVDGKIYAVGGFGHIRGRGVTNAYGSLPYVDVYDPAADQWTARAPLRLARGRVGLAAGPDGQIYAIGGWTAVPPASPTQPLLYNASSSVERYDPAKDTWSDFEPLNQARGALGVARSRDGMILAVGGQGSYGPGLPDATAFRELESLS